MQKYNVITYRLNKSVNPGEVLMTVESLMQKYSAQYQNCLFKTDVSIAEFEFEGISHSNSKKNAIISICKKYPNLEAFHQHIKEDNGEGHIQEKLSISNFSDQDYSRIGDIDYSIIHDVATKIPRPYSVNSLELIFDGISFSTTSDMSTSIKPSKSGFGPPIGNYILYERYAYGSEKHSYVIFSADDANIENMRGLFFELADTVKGRYDGTEIQN